VAKKWPIPSINVQVLKKLSFGELHQLIPEKGLCPSTLLGTIFVLPHSPKFFFLAPPLGGALIMLPIIGGA